MVEIAIGAVVGGLTGLLGVKRDWSFLKTLLIANAIVIPTIIFVRAMSA